MPNSIYGYFDNPHEESPAYDPGLSVDCPVCNEMLSVPIKTISLMLANDERSYFYRTHKACYEGLSPDEQVKLDSVLIDAIASKGNVN